MKLNREKKKALRRAKTYPRWKARQDAIAAQIKAAAIAAAIRQSKES